MASATENPMQYNIRLWIRNFYSLGNLILTLLGIGGLAVSIISKMDKFDDLTLLDYYQSINTNVFLAFSVMLIVISWLGIFASGINSYKLTLTNGALLSFFLVATTGYTIAMGLLTDYTKNGDLYRQMKKNMKQEVTYIVNKLQTKLSCCGLDDITIWNTIPPSCCRDIETKCILGSPYLQTNGCFKEFLRMSRYYAWLIFSVLIFAGLIEIFTMMLSYVQCRIIKDVQRKKRAVEELKIPRPQVASMHIENESRDSEKENEKKNEKDNEKENEKKKENDKDNEKENEKKKENDEDNEKETENKKENKKDNKKVNVKENKEEEKKLKEKEKEEKNRKEGKDEEKQDKVEKGKEEDAKQNECRNIHTDVTSAHVNINEVFPESYLNTLPSGSLLICFL